MRASARIDLPDTLFVATALLSQLSGHHRPVWTSFVVAGRTREAAGVVALAPLAVFLLGPDLKGRFGLVVATVIYWRAYGVAWQMNAPLLALLASISPRL